MKIFYLQDYYILEYMLSNDLLKDISVINEILKDNGLVGYKVTNIKGFWSSSEGISIEDTHIIKNDGLKVIIFTSEEGYISPKDFQNNYEDHWTLKNDDYLVKGKIESIKSITELKDKYEYMKITNVSLKDYGSLDMQHFEVIGE